MEKNLKPEPLKLVKAGILTTRARAYHQKGDLDKAKELFMESLKLRGEIALKTRSAMVMVDGYYELFLFHKAENNVAEAVANVSKAIEHQEAYVKERPNDFPRRRHLGNLCFEKGKYLYDNKQFQEARDSFLEGKKHEVQAFQSSKQGPDYVQNLYATYRMLCVTQVELKDYAGAVRSINERISHWPADAEKIWDAAKDLAVIYQRDHEQLGEVVKFLERAFEKNLLTVQRVRDEPSFTTLRATADYTLLERKYAKN